ncbi:MAG: Ig-like domain-containing protein, partial [Calditrichia bacterium]
MPKMKTLFKQFLSTPCLLILFILIVIVSIRCAHKVAPPGGPEDKSPPKIIYTFPPADSTNIQVLPYLEILFDEAVEKTSFADQVWFIPEMKKGFKLKWKGSKKLRVLLQDSLEKNQTYIFNIGTGVKDLRGN